MNTNPTTTDQFPGFKKRRALKVGITSNGQQYYNIHSLLSKLSKAMRINLLSNKHIQPSKHIQASVRTSITSKIDILCSEGSTITNTSTPQKFAKSIRLPLGTLCSLILSRNSSNITEKYYMLLPLLSLISLNFPTKLEFWVLIN